MYSCSDDLPPLYCKELDTEKMILHLESKLQDISKMTEIDALADRVAALEKEILYTLL